MAEATDDQTGAAVDAVGVEAQIDAWHRGWSAFAPMPNGRGQATENAART